jgi:hypothetical protein
LSKEGQPWKVKRVWWQENVVSRVMHIAGVGAVLVLVLVLCWCWWDMQGNGDGRDRGGGGDTCTVRG